MRLLLIAVLLATFALPVFSQKGEVIARQATVAEDPVQDIDSPMVLEIPLPPKNRMAPSQSVSLGEKIKNFRCEDTTFASLLIRRQFDRGRREKAQARFEVSGLIAVRPSYDRHVDLRFSFLKGDQEFAIGEDRKIDAEEDKTRAFKARLTLPVSQFDDLFEGEDEPRLKVLMTVRDNK